MKNILIILLVTFVCSCKAQNVENLTYKSLKNILVDFLNSKNEINNERAIKYKSGEYKFNLRGVFNNWQEEKLKKGIYAFSSFGSHSRAYFVIVENEKYTILDISTREGLDLAIKNVLDFSEKQKYCVDITEKYISKLISVYYNINKKPGQGIDINCEKGISNTDDLP